MKSTWFWCETHGDYALVPQCPQCETLKENAKSPALSPSPDGADAARLTEQDWKDLRILALKDKDYTLADKIERIQGSLSPSAAGVLPVARRQGLTFEEVITASTSRATRWYPGGLTDWSPLEWAGAMAGEAGEACNAAKKLKRIEDGILNVNTEDGRSLTEHNAACMQIGKEVADTILYAVLVCARVGVPLVPVLIDVFNKKSEEYGFPERLPSPVTAGAAPPEHVHARSWFDDACDCWRCECGAWLGRDVKPSQPGAADPTQEAP